jgi:hypothetical protein
MDESGLVGPHCRRRARASCCTRRGRHSPGGPPPWPGRLQHRSCRAVGMSGSCSHPLVRDRVSPRLCRRRLRFMRCGPGRAAQATRPSSPARCVASARDRQSSFLRVCRTCVSTVRGLRNSSRAIWRFARPTATKRSTWSSRRVRPPGSRSVVARRPSRCSARSPSSSRRRAAIPASGCAPSFRAVR